MTDHKDNVTHEQRQLGLAPETHNDEQDDHLQQAQAVANEARAGTSESPGGTESRKAPSSGIGNVAGSERDVIDAMRDMEEKGRIDHSAYAGEPNHDDNTGKYDGKER